MRMRQVATAAAIALVATIYPAPASAAAPGTAAALDTAMHDEATAYADYSAWASHADSAGHHHLASLLATIAGQERDEHYAELASAANLVADTVTNLQTSTLGEIGEAENIYPAMAAQAVADGDSVTAALFRELADDEDSHQRLLDAASRALRYGGIWTVPIAPDTDPVRIVEGPALATGRTLDNVRQAMRGEAYASAKYRLFAQAAYASGQAKVGRLFAGLSTIELAEHYAALANRYGLVRSDQANLWAAVQAENGAIMAYARWSSDATTVGDTASYRLLAGIMGDEVDHRELFIGASGTL